MPEEHTHHHHHHHHHHRSEGEHRSGSSSTSVQSYRPSSSDYSLRSFGKKGVDDTPLPEGTISAAVFSACITALILGPIIIALIYRNKSLNDEIFALRTQLGTVMEQSGNTNPDLLSPAKKPVKTRYVSTETDSSVSGGKKNKPTPTLSAAEAVRSSLEEEMNEEEEEEAREIVTRRVVEPARVLPSIPDEQIAKAVNMSLDEIAALKRDIALEPNGQRIEEADDGTFTFTPDPFLQNLQGAFDLLALGQSRDAESIFGMLSAAKPQWPYGHFYKAVAGKDKDELTKANLLFSTIRALGRQTPESELYSALTSLFLKENTAATSTLLRIPAMTAGRPALQVGPVLVPKSTSPEILKQLKSLPGVKVVKELDW